MRSFRLNKIKRKLSDLLWRYSCPGRKLDQDNSIKSPNLFHRVRASKQDLMIEKGSNKESRQIYTKNLRAPFIYFFFPLARVLSSTLDQEDGKEFRQHDSLVYIPPFSYLKERNRSKWAGSVKKYNIDQRPPCKKIFSSSRLSSPHQRKSLFFT